MNARTGTGGRLTEASWAADRSDLASVHLYHLKESCEVRSLLGLHAPAGVVGRRWSPRKATSWPIDWLSQPGQHRPSQEDSRRFRLDIAAITGLDGYIRNTTIFQFFGDQAGTSSAQRSKAQKGKLRDELPKVKRNAGPIGQLVGTGVGEYVLLVSQLEDKSVIEYAGEREGELQSWQLAYLAADCRIVVKDIDYLQHEWELLYGAVRSKLDLPIAPPNLTLMTGWAATIR
jgi:hypothetical protein